MFNNEELSKMSKEQLVMYIVELQDKLVSLADAKKSTAGVVLSGAKPYVQEYIKRVRETLKKGGDK